MSRYKLGGHKRGEGWARAWSSDSQIDGVITGKGEQSIL